VRRSVPDGHYISLEVNSTGQWMRLELLTSIPISEAIAAALPQGQGEIARWALTCVHPTGQFTAMFRDRAGPAYRR
jgi:hypothetical protein